MTVCQVRYGSIAGRKEYAKSLRDKGLSYGSIGLMLGVSRQRVHQMVSGYGGLIRSGNRKGGWYRTLKRAVLTRDHNQCVQCGTTSSLLVHHLDSNDHHNDITNPITLCACCHTKLHSPVNFRRRDMPDHVCLRCGHKWRAQSVCPKTCPKCNKSWSTLPQPKPTTCLRGHSKALFWNIKNHRCAECGREDARASYRRKHPAIIKDAS